MSAVRPGYNFVLPVPVSVCHCITNLLLQYISRAVLYIFSLTIVFVFFYKFTLVYSITISTITISISISAHLFYFFFPSLSRN